MSNKSYCTIYLVRHGKTDWNEKELIQGHTDIPLNSEGEQQARDLAKELRNIKFDKIYSSDLSRAKRTAEIIVEKHKLTVETTKALRERNYAHLEGEHKSRLKEMDDAIKLLNNEEKFTYKHQKIESMSELMDRFLAHLRKIAASNHGKKILMVTHGGPMWVLLSLLKKIDIDRHFIKIKNLAYIKIESDGINFLVKGTNGIIIRQEQS